VSLRDDVSVVKHLGRHLRKYLHPMVPVRVYFRDKMPPNEFENDYTGLDGLCVINSNGRKATSFSIFILNGSLREMIDTLKHEWSHTLAWSMTGEQDDDHGAPWGLAVAQVQQCFEMWTYR
jgi:hypothetical protein